MDTVKELFAWPTVLWTGMICLVGMTLLGLTICDHFYKDEPKSKRKTKHGK